MPMLYTIENDYLKVTVSDVGAELQSIRSKTDDTEYLWQGDPTYWKNRAPNLFPYVGRLTEGKYLLDGKEYTLPIHGFAPTAQFEGTAQTGQSIVLHVTDTLVTYAQYPRSFTMSVIYLLHGNTLIITYRVENRDERRMYFGIGGHPGFCVPMEKGLSFEDYHLRFRETSQPNRIGFTEKCFLDGTESPFELENRTDIPLAHSLFDNDAIVLKDMARCVTLESGKGSHGVTVTFPQMQYLGIWHKPKTDAPYVCIEPWCSLPATQDVITIMEKQPDLVELEAGEIYENNWSIQCF